MPAVSFDGACALIEAALDGGARRAILEGVSASNDFTHALREDPARYEQILGRIPAGRWGEPHDLAGAIVLLCSPAGAYITGTVLAVDGGWLSR